MKAFLFGILALPLTLLAVGAVEAAGTVEKATFAGGCFWCMEHPFDSLPGVLSVTSGYTGGRKKNPTYKEVSAGGPDTRRRFRSSTTLPRYATKRSSTSTGTISIRP